MKKINTILVSITLAMITTTSFASYTPTEEDKKTITQLDQQIEKLSENNKDIWNFYYQLKTLKKNIKNNERLHYLLGNLEEKSYKRLQAKKEEAKQKSKEQKEKLVEKYGDKISEGEGVSDRCKKYYTLIDDISFAYDFPTSATIATRYRETSCRRYLPENKNGPFQIITKDYGTGELTEEKFIGAVIDFLNFTERKFSTRGERTKKNINYNTIDLESFVNFGGLYNAGKSVEGVIVPLHPWYIFDKYQGKYKDAKRYGTRPYMLKVLERELKNQY